MISTFTVERVISGSGSKFDTEATLEHAELHEAILAYLKAFHTGHPTWIIDDTTGKRLTNEEVELGLERLLKKVMV